MLFPISTACSGVNNPQRLNSLYFQGLSSQSIQISTLASQDVLEATEVISSAFMDEPMTQALGFTLEDCRSVFRPRMQQGLKDGLTLVAKNKGKVVGVIWNADENGFFAPPENSDKITALRLPATHLSTALEDIPTYKKLKTDFPQLGQIFYLGCLAVLPGYRHLGVGKLLLEDSLELARRNGFSYATIVATSEGSQKISTRLGFKCLNELPYTSEPRLSQLSGVIRLDLKAL